LAVLGNHAAIALFTALATPH